MDAATIGCMDSGDASLPQPSPAPALGAPSSRPATPQLPHDPFGTPTPARARARNLRGRIGGVLAAVGALVVKFFSAIKGAVLLLPKLKVLTSAGKIGRASCRERV